MPSRQASTLASIPAAMHLREPRDVVVGRLLLRVDALEGFLGEPPRHLGHLAAHEVPEAPAQGVAAHDDGLAARVAGRRLDGPRQPGEDLDAQVVDDRRHLDPQLF